MKNKINRKYVQIGKVAFAVIVCATIFFLLCIKMREFQSALNRLIGILKPIIYGLIIAYLLTPLTNYMERKILYPLYLKNHNSIPFKWKRVFRVLSIIVTIVVIISLFTILMSFVIPQLVSSIKSIATILPAAVVSLQDYINHLIDSNESIVSMLTQYININYESDDLVKNLTKIIPFLSSGVQGLSNGIFSMVTNLWNFIIGIIVAIYVMLNKEIFASQAKKATYALLSKEKANQLIKDTRFVSDTFTGFLGGKIVDSLIVFILCLIGCAILKTPYLLLVSVIIGVTNIIPFFGPFIGAVPSALLILMVDPIKSLYFVIFVLILQQLDGNVIGPLILGDSTGLSGFWVIFSITVFGGLWGVMGMIIGIPFFAVVYAMIKRYIERQLKNKNLPTLTSDYRFIKSFDDDGNIIELFEANDLNFKHEPHTRKELIEKIKHNKHKNIEEVESIDINDNKDEIKSNV